MAAIHVFVSRSDELLAHQFGQDLNFLSLNGGHPKG